MDYTISNGSQTKAMEPIINLGRDVNGLKSLQEAYKVVHSIGARIKPRTTSWVSFVQTLSQQIRKGYDLNDDADDFGMGITVLSREFRKLDAEERQKKLDDMSEDERDAFEAEEADNKRRAALKACARAVKAHGITWAEIQDALKASK